MEKLIQRQSTVRIVECAPLNPIRLNDNRIPSLKVR